jgi:hypothetical protein
MKVKEEQGYLIVASNNSNTDYIACAKVLAMSIRYWMPGAKICLLTDKEIESDVFDYVRLFPYGDQDDTDWKLSNDWQVFHSSPFRETIKLEADMIVTSDISHWWTMLQHRDVVIATQCKDFRDNIATNRQYRKIFDLNNLPDVYNAITYWRLSKTAQEFFNLVRDIFEEWDDYKTIIKGAIDEIATTDLVYAIAATIIGIEKVTLPGSYPTLVHMKPSINNTLAKDWRKQLVWELVQGEFRINTISQRCPVHYHVKDFAQELEPIYEQLLRSS